MSWAQGEAGGHSVTSAVAPYPFDAIESAPARVYVCS